MRSMTKWFTLMIACLALGLVVAGCGGDDENGGDSGGGGAAETSVDTGGGEAEGGETDGGGAEAPSGGGKEVAMKDIAFEPATIEVAKGETVTWVNDDSVDHDVTAEDDSFSSGDPGGMAPGDSYDHTFDEAGTFKYVCTVHPGMEGDVVVK